MSTTEQVLARAKLLRLKYVQIRLQYEKFLRTTVTKIVEENIINRIKARMAAVGLDQKIIDAVSVSFIAVKGKEVKIRIRSDYESENGFDVAYAVENGTDDHWIEPKESSLVAASVGAPKDTPKGQRKKKALHWVEHGNNYFSKGHVVGGIPRHRIIKNTIKEFGPQTREKILTALSKWSNDILQGNT